MFPTQPFPAVTTTIRKGISRTDVQALGLILMILMVIDLPIYHSAVQRDKKQNPSPVVAAHTVPIRTASAQIAFPHAFKPNVSRLTTRSGASTRGLAH